MLLRSRSSLFWFLQLGFGLISPIDLSSPSHFASMLTSHVATSLSDDGRTKPPDLGLSRSTTSSSADSMNSVLAMSVSPSRADAIRVLPARVVDLARSMLVMQILSPAVFSLKFSSHSASRRRFSKSARMDIDHRASDECADARFGRYRQQQQQSLIISDQPSSLTAGISAFNENLDGCDWRLASLCFCVCVAHNDPQMMRQILSSKAHLGSASNGVEVAIINGPLELRDIKAKQNITKIV
jgi:hypothetical protein